MSDVARGIGVNDVEMRSSDVGARGAELSPIPRVFNLRKPVKSCDGPSELELMTPFRLSSPAPPNSICGTTGPIGVTYTRSLIGSARPLAEINSVSTFACCQELRSRNLPGIAGSSSTEWRLCACANDTASPHAMCLLWPTATAGKPGNEAPVTS